MKILNLIFIILLALTIIASGIFISLPETENKNKELQLKEVTLRQGWIPNGRYAPFLIAEEKGYYAQEGLTLKMTGVKGSPLAAKIVASGEDDFGMASGNTVLIGKTKGMPLVVIAAIFQKTPTCVIYLKDNIKKINDLEGKKVALDPSSTRSQEFESFAKKNNIDLQKIRFIPASGTPQEQQALIDGTADVAVQYCYAFEPILEKNELDYEKFMLDDYGVPIYSQSIIIHENLIAKDPDLVKRFLRASIKGWIYSIDHPEEAISLFVEHYPEQDYKTNLASFIKMKGLVENDITENNGFGSMTYEQWSEMQEMLFELGLINNKIDLASLYTNDFLEK